MEKTHLSEDSQERQRVFEHIFDGAMGNPIDFSSTPSLTDMDSNSWGFNGNDIYIKTSAGLGIKLSGASFS